MNNYVKTAALTLSMLGSGVANAESNESNTLDPVVIVHHCETDKDYGQVIAVTNEFDGRLQSALEVEPKELAAAKKAKAKETMRSALLELSPEQMKVLGGKITLLTQIKRGENTEEDLKTEDSILAEIEKKVKILSTLVTIDKEGRMQIVPVDETSETVQRRDVQAAFGELNQRDIVCSPDFISYVIAKDSVPFLSPEGNNSAAFDAFVTDLHPTVAPAVAATVAPVVAKKAANAPVDQNVVYARQLMKILSSYGDLQKNTPQAIVAYTAYMEGTL